MPGSERQGVAANELLGSTHASECQFDDFSASVSEAVQQRRRLRRRKPKRRDIEDVDEASSEENDDALFEANSIFNDSGSVDKAISEESDDELFFEAKSIKKNRKSGAKCCIEHAADVADTRETQSKRGSSKSRKPRKRAKTTTELNSQISDEHPLQKVGDYVLEFQNDGTGRKFIHPSAMRAALKLAEKEGDKTIKLVAKKLEEEGQVAESRIVKEQSHIHVEEILSRVRRRLATEKIPDRYIKIEDVITADLALTNARRRQEIEENKAELAQLKKQRVILEKERNEARDRRNRLLKEKAKESSHSFHPLLEQHEDDNNNDDTDKKPAATSTATKAAVRKDLLESMFASVSSPYD